MEPILTRKFLTITITISHKAAMKINSITKLISILVMMIAGLSFAQSSNENYVQSKNCLNDDCSKISETITYFDGLGRAKQIVNVKASPTGKDFVTPVVYDNFGRQIKDILPVPAQTQNSSIHTGITDESAANAYYGVSNAYAEKQLENSPLDRLLQQAAPGEAWKMSSGKTRKFTYEANLGNEVKKFGTTTTTSTVNNVSTMVSALWIASANSGFYPASTLYKNMVTDEDGNPVTVFRNSQGQTLLTRRNDGSQNVDTYYVYNEYNKLAFVISPKALQQIELNNNIITDEILNELCYQYRYDGRNREVEKKSPGKDWEFTVYDKQDRPVLVQDGNLRTTGNNFGSKGWIFTKYDEFGRVVYTGFFSNTASRQVMQNALNSMVANASNNEKRSSSFFTLQGVDVYYNKQAFPTGSMTLLSVNYYDTYPPEAPAIPPTILGQYILAQNMGSTDDASTIGILTASFIKNIEDNNWTKSYYYYDSSGRKVGVKSTNHLGGYTNVETELDFLGAPKRSITYHLRKAGEVGVMIQERFTYDSQNRLVSHYHQVDNNPEELLSENTYNELYQLINKKVGSNENYTPLQSVDFNYNIRGWLTGINQNKMQVADLGGKLFSYKIKYNEKDGISNPDPLQFPGKEVAAKYNGNIAEVDWRSVENIGNNPPITPKRYGYVYNKLDRLTAGFYQTPGNPSIGENTESLEYDLNGNITKLFRTSILEYGNTTPTKIDDLVYTYSAQNKGNKLIAVNDNSFNPTGYEGGGLEIKYDVNGNITSIPDKGINTLKYNYLNLPNNVSYSKSGSESMIINTKYGSDGDKVQKENTTTIFGINGYTTIKKVTDYLDGFQYLTTINSSSSGGGGSSESMMMSNAETGRAMEIQAYSLDDSSSTNRTPITTKNPNLQFFPTSEGFYDYAKNQYIYQYKDQLGNVRISFGRNSAGALEIVDGNDYYPFGMNHLKSGNSFFGTSSLRNYKFLGNELQETGFYDMNARFYMADLGRFGTHDPFSDATLDPYSYAYNSPVIFSDPTGLFGEPIPQLAPNAVGGDNNPAPIEEVVINAPLRALASKPASTMPNNCGVCYGGVGFTIGNLPPPRKEIFLPAQFYDHGMYAMGPTDLGAMLVQNKLEEHVGERDAQFLMTLASVGLFVTGTLRETPPATPPSPNLWKVGKYKALRGLEKGLDAHHVGQSAMMRRLIANFDHDSAPAILVPKAGHRTKLPEIGRMAISRGSGGFENARQVLARDIFELRRVYGAQGIPNEALQELIQLNKTMYEGAFIKAKE